MSIYPFKIVTYLAYLLIALIIVALFAENFIFSSNLGLLAFREIDDIAFQASLKSIHANIENGNFHKLFELNDYAYGWIYWLPMAIITYPFYLLSNYLSFDVALIVLPREISLFFAIGSLVVLRKILKIMKVEEWACALALLIFALYPTFGYFSMRFGTVNEAMFFSILTLYFAIKDNPSTLKGRNLIVITLAVAGGIKLSALLITPLILALIVLNMQEREWKKIIKSAKIPALLFILSLVVFINPSLLISPAKPQIAKDYWYKLHYFLQVTKTISSPTDLLSIAFGNNINKVIMLFIAAGLPIYATREKKWKFILAILATLLIASLYLLFSVKNGASAGAYFTAVSFLFLFGVVGWTYNSIGTIALLIIIPIMFVNSELSAINQYKTQVYTNYLYFNHWTYFVKSIKFKDDLENAEKIDKCIDISDKKEWKGHIFIDFSTPTTVNILTYPNAHVSIAWNNLSPAGKYYELPVNYLILDKMAVGALPKEEFDDKFRVADPKIAEGYVKDRESRTELFKSGNFANQHFKLICEYGRVQVFKFAP